MSIAIKCDRCGKTYEPYNFKNDPDKINGIITANIDRRRIYEEHGFMDLCPECSDTLIKWLKKKGELK